MNIKLRDIGIICAPCGRGKSRAALAVADMNLEIERNVMFITVENDESWVESKIQSEKGWLIVDTLMMGNSELLNIEDILSKWKIKIGFEPDILIIDNIEYIGKQHELLDDKLAYLSDLQHCYGIDVWTTLNGRRVR